MAKIIDATVIGREAYTVVKMHIENKFGLQQQIADTMTINMQPVAIV